MATTTLTLGAVSLGAAPGEPVLTPHANEAVVGDPPQWSDEDDATHASVSNLLPSGEPGGGAAHAQADPVAGNLLGFTARVRASADTSSLPEAAELYVYLRHVGTNGYADTGYFSVPNDGAIHEATLSGTVYDDNNPDGWLAEGIYVVARQTTNFCLVHIHEVTVTVTTDVEDVIRPATRMFPRDDALGLGSAPRLYPPPKRGRVVGGYQ